MIVDLHGDDPEPIVPVALEQVYVSLLRALDPDGPVPATVDEQASGYHDFMSHLDRLSRPGLLVVDNADSTDQIVRLLPAGQVHRVLITSRRALEGLSGVIGHAAPAIPGWVQTRRRPQSWLACAGMCRWYYRSSLC